MGKLSQSNPIDSCTFVFKNTGTRPLQIVQVFTSCTCTATDYTQTHVNPGKTGYIKMIYNGKGMLPGKFTRTITVYSNAKTDTVRLHLVGEIEGDKK